MNQKGLMIMCLCFAFMMSAVPSHAVDTLYRLPLASNPGYYGWFDHNNTSGKKLRYDCATSFNYDGHKGTDFKATTGTSIYSGAKGDIYYRYDGCPDDGSNQQCGGGYGNHIRIVHADGRVTIYAHMQKGTPVAIKNGIACSTYVGKSGNSGTSSAPHLHFELWDNKNTGTRRDFFSGNCNAKGFWVNQNNGWPTTTCQ